MIRTSFALLVLCSLIGCDGRRRGDDDDSGADGDADADGDSDADADGDADADADADGDSDADADGDADGDADADDCLTPDDDADGYADRACGGDDCDDAAASIHPGALDGPPDGRAVDLGVTGLEVVVAVGADAVRHVGWRSSDGDVISHGVVGADGELESEIVAADLAGGNHALGLAIGPDGAAHIAYQSGGEVRVATNGSGTWESEWVAATGQTALRLPIAVASDGTVHIAYGEADNHMGYAVRDGGVWTAAEIDDHRDTGQELSLALDADLHPHVVYGASFDPELRHATNASGEWVIELTEYRGVATPTCAYAADGALEVIVGHNGNLNHTEHVAGEWRFVEQDDGNNFGFDMATDAESAAHAAYHDYDLDFMLYGTDALGEWQAFHLGPALTSTPGLDVGPDGIVSIAWQNRQAIMFVSFPIPAAVDRDCDGTVW